jgi:hypothetical protein
VTTPSRSTGQDKVRERLAEIAASAESATEGPWDVIYDTCECGGEYGCEHGQFAYAVRTPQHDAWGIAASPESDICDPAKPDDYFHHQRSELGDFPTADVEFITDARSSVPALVAALTAVLDEFDYYSQNGTEDEQDVIAAIRRKLAAGLGVTP